MDIKWAESNIGEISLAAVLAGILIVHLLRLGSNNELPVWVEVIVIFVWELVLGVEHFALVHDGWAGVEVKHGLLELAAVEEHDSSEEVEVFLVEYVLLVIVSFFIVKWIIMLLLFIIIPAITILLLVSTIILPLSLVLHLLL
jgi:hypothetical protein